MKIPFFSLISLVLSTSFLYSQNVNPPVVSDFSGSLSFLASNWMEGREAGTKGGFMAADYIASMMELYQLEPFGDKNSIVGNKRDFFQDFKIIKNTLIESKLAFVNPKNDSEKIISLTQNIDFEINAGLQSQESQAKLVFVGYGLSLPKQGYDDYKNISVKGKIVVAMTGFPGHKDSTSVNWKKIGPFYKEKSSLDEDKIQLALSNGAIGIILIDASGNFKPELYSQSSDTYNDESIHTLENIKKLTIPCFKLDKKATILLFEGTGIHPNAIETKTAQKINYCSRLIKNKMIRFSTNVHSESIPVRNVIGMIKGKDSTKTIIIGAHYDHLGIHNSRIFNGADDNASGASGLLALAKKWSDSKIQPAVNLIFASWTAEELGLLGSEYFVENRNLNSAETLLYINMDMISRNAPEDIEKRMLSIGTQKGDLFLKNIVIASNNSLSNPFKLDIWETNGHTGSDYASFTTKKIPIMTFFAGYHKDYHTPRDIVSKVDLNKMKNVLEIVTNCLQEFIKTTK